MTLLEAIEARHSVRRYKDEPIPAEVLAVLQDKVREINRKAGLHVQLALLAPTAVNQQKFFFEYRAGGQRPQVTAKPLFSLMGYTKIDLGIVKLHFEIGAGTEHFEWA